MTMIDLKQNFKSKALSCAFVSLSVALVTQPICRKPQPFQWYLLIA